LIGRIVLVPFPIFAMQKAELKGHNLSSHLVDVLHFARTVSPKTIEKIVV
jgi:hypothetical protein